MYRLKMEKAAYYLRNSPDKIYEVGERLGYRNPSYFIKLFKKYFRVTPNEYRRTFASGTAESPRK